jgi:ElaB/YqjD/DUF883 family membrane-anchored ribosome-binding protein
MSYQNGQTVSDVKKATSKFASDAKSEIKSNTSNASNASNAKSVTSKIEKTGESIASEGSSLADTVLSSVSAFLPVKNTEAARELLESTAKDVRSNLMTARDATSSFIKRYPFYSLLAAGMIGAAAVMMTSPRKARPASPDLH